MSPAILLGFQYRFKKPFILNAGLEYAGSRPVFTSTTSAPKEGSTVIQTYSPMAFSFNIGGSWNPTPKFSIDASFTNFLISSDLFDNFGTNTTLDLTNIPFQFNFLATIKL
ncbi:hypothetical protein AGMMS49991_01000 [Spirochaetia bacterium]|nr:hypothetical protein AGMMS49991_01000 [Spirochaetia bacterium]